MSWSDFMCKFPAVDHTERVDGDSSFAVGFVSLCFLSESDRWFPKEAKLKNIFDSFYSTHLVA